MNKQRLDPHSYYEVGQPRTQHIQMALKVLFKTHQLQGTATIRFDGSGPVTLDTRDLAVKSISTIRGRAITFKFGETDAILGTPLHFTLPQGETVAVIVYKTAPNARGLYWLEPAQTLGGRHPFMFSQGQHHHTRSFLPCQDTASIRFTYEALLIVPEDLVGLMAAYSVGRTQRIGNLVRTQWDMPYRIPSYLLAFAVGNLVSREISHRTRLWGEPEIIQAGEWEFAEMENYMAIAERTWVPYPWPRFDILLLSPYFPYGGMENPMLAFISSLVVTGDRSGKIIPIHEMLHGIFGNLITNATLADFWLNEGWTTYGQMRVLEVLDGTEAVELIAFLSRIHAQTDKEQCFKGRPHLSRLVPTIQDEDPDDLVTGIPYFKGYRFLKALEEHVGRTRFDAFTLKYIQRFAFESITTEQFFAFTKAHLPGALKAINYKAWFKTPEVLPAHCPPLKSSRVDYITQKAKSGQVPEAADGASWTPREWRLYAESLQRPVAPEFFQELENHCGLTEHPNHATRYCVFRMAIESGRVEVLPALDEFMGSMGNVGIVRSLYAAMVERKDMREEALAMFRRHRPRYHPIVADLVKTQVFTKAGLTV